MRNIITPMHQPFFFNHTIGRPFIAGGFKSHLQAVAVREYSFIVVKLRRFCITCERKC